MSTKRYFNRRRRTGTLLRRLRTTSQSRRARACGDGVGGDRAVLGVPPAIGSIRFLSKKRGRRSRAFNSRSRSSCC